MSDISQQVQFAGINPNKYLIINNIITNNIFLKFSYVKYAFFSLLV